MQNTLYYGDNLDWLTNDKVFPAAFVDLVYLDPPFNSNRNYNVLFKGKAGHEAQAQIHAFTDTWEWSEEEYGKVRRSQRVPSKVKDALEAMVGLTGKNDLTGYLVMMAPRLAELHRVLKPTGSLYLHCDTTASHYLKLLLDAVFGVENYRNEITWKRTTGRSHTNHDSKRWGDMTDIILFYARSEQTPLKMLHRTNNASYIASSFTHKDPDGRLYMIDNLASPSPRLNLMYEYKGYKPPAKGWAVSREKMEQWDVEGRLHFPTSTSGRIRRKRYLDELEGETIQNLWDDINAIGSQAKERLGYPTQKPLALLRRIIEASSNAGDIVLDPFCGCGTAVVAAEELNRHWLGIDITSLAIGVVEKRIVAVHPDANFVVQGLPDREEDALELARRNKYDFQDWVVLKLGGQPIHESAPGKAKKGADDGIDGVIYFEDAKGSHKAYISVKGGQNYGVEMLRDLDGAVNDKGGVIGVLVIIGEPTRPMRELANRSPLWESEDSLGNVHEYPRLQVISVDDLIKKGVNAIRLPLHYEEQTMQTARRGQRRDGEQLSYIP